MEIRALPLVLLMLPIFYCIASFLEYLDERTDTKCRNLMLEPFVMEKNPGKELLSQITRNKVFKQTSELFQKAVLEKLAACDAKLTAIEKTMSPSQLYQAGNPHWTSQLNIITIKYFYKLEEQLMEQGVKVEDYIDEYVQDCKNGMVPHDAQHKQLRKYGIH